MLKTMDKYFFNLINGFAGRSGLLDGLAVFFAVYSEYVLLFILAGLLLFNFKKHWKMVFSGLIISAVSRFVVASLIRFMWFRPRPFVENSVNLLVNHSGEEASFPSGHASFYFALSTVVFLHNRKLGIFFYFVTVIMTLSRVFIGIHWPVDILFGALLGIFMGWIGNKIFKKYIFH